MKYVIHKVTKDGVSQLVPMVFPDKLVHAYVSERMATTMRKHWPGANVTVHSAGSIMLPGFTCRRGSETLNIPAHKDPHEQDTRTILFMDQAHFTMFEED